MKIKVEGCNDCPFRFDGAMGGMYCLASKDGRMKDIPGTEGARGLPDGKRASWCPLENSDVVVSLDPKVRIRS